jgi:general secretion pathway protein G
MIHRSPLLAAASSRRGMSLVEIMVVIAIIGIVGTVIATGVLGALGEANQSAACIQMKNIEQAMIMYAAKHKNKFPSTSEGLAAATVYLADKEVPTDPWGNAYQYFSPGTHGAHDIEIISLGKDGREGGTDEAKDLYSWECGK